MNTVKAPIASIRRIAKNSKKEPINLIVIELANGKPNIVRRLAQFVRDLDGSGRLEGTDPDFLTTVNHPVIVRACKKLKGGVVEGNFVHVKEGEEYEVTANMSVVTDPTHPNFGTVSEGDKLKYKVDQTIVQEGFLELEANMQTQMVEEQAYQLAQMMQQSMNGFSGGANTSSTSTASEGDDLDVDDFALENEIGQVAENAQ